MKVWTLTLITLLLLINNTYSQTRKIIGDSKKISISIPKEIPKPPYLEIKDYRFEDSDGNNIIDAEEIAIISFDVVNSGLGVSTELDIRITEKNGLNGLSFETSKKIQGLKADESIRVTIEIKGLMTLKTGKALFSIEAREGNGFHSDPVVVEVETDSFREPLVKTVDHQISNHSGTIEKRKPFDIELLIQNIGQGIAHDVILSLRLPTHVFCLSANDNETIGTLGPGEKRLISYNLVTNNEYSSSSIELDFQLTEKYGKYAEGTKIPVELNQKVSTDKLVVEGASRKDQEISIASLTSDIDRNIPENRFKNPKKVVLIFGNENYDDGYNAEINVDYARRDAETFKSYAIKTLGADEKNVFYYPDATSGVMKREIERTTELVKRIGSETELIFFYAGHGLPDENNATPYLIPVDVNATNLGGAIPLSDLYTKLADTKAKKVTVILDACFSGGGRTNGLLAARAVRIKPKAEGIVGNMIVFAAAQGEQTALPYHEEKHGLFSYFLMKKLQESSGSATFGEMSEYLKEWVGIEAIRVNGKPQDPDVLVSPSINDQWKEMTF